MARQVIKVTRPTKIELIRLRRRLALASRIQKIVKDRVSILILEFLQIARQTVEAKQKLLDEFSRAYRTLSIAAGYHGYIALEKELLATEEAQNKLLFKSLLTTLKPLMSEGLDQAVKSEH